MQTVVKRGYRLAVAHVTLVTVAHGTRHPTGNDVARALTAAAGERLGMAAVTSYVELSEPLFADVMAALTEPAVVVPLLLSTGYHVTVDLPRAVARASAPVRWARRSARTRAGRWRRWSGCARRAPTRASRW